ncbi:hypothetical protein MKMG_00542 [Methanogenium sp. MK-MG]|nr:hypothetical protein MKMG_00542 [Methanogenium sp. MK-MG]
MVGLVGVLAYVTAYAWEDVAVNTTSSGGRIIFLDNTSHGTFFLGAASADFEKNTAFSNSVPLIETGMGGSTFTASWKNNQNNELGSGKTAVFTMTVWDPAGVPHSTTRESGKIYSGTLSVSCSPLEPGDGRFLLTSTIYEKRPVRND